MDLSTIEVPPDVAAERLAEYQQALRTERSAQDEALAAAYRAASRGQPIIQLAKTIAAGGFFENGLPKIAVVRADSAACFVHWERWGDGRQLIFSAEDTARNDGALVGRATVRVPVTIPPVIRGHSSWDRATTIVPSIPPRFRPHRPRRLSRCHLLWEVESWTYVPPRDPALIRHLRGDLWAVLAVWDLTELERAVLAM